MRREARVVGQLGTAHRVAEPAEDAVLVRGDHHPQVVARLEDVRRRDALQVRAHRLTDEAEPVVLGHGALEQRERRLHQRDVDDLPTPVAEHVAVVERRQDALDGEHRGERVAERDSRARRRLVRKAVDVAEASHRLRDGGVARALGVRPGLAVPGDAREDDAGIHRRQLLVAEVPALERAGAEVLGDDVRDAHELEQQLLPLRLAQVQRDALLVPRLDGPPEGAAFVAGLAPVAERIRLAGRLDLDHLGAHVAEQPAGERPGEQRAELDQPQARKRPGAPRSRSVAHRVTIHRPCSTRPSNRRRLRARAPSPSWPAPRRERRPRRRRPRARRCAPSACGGGRRRETPRPRTSGG